MGIHGSRVRKREKMRPADQIADDDERLLNLNLARSISGNGEWVGATPKEFYIL
jgi:hypothetical protein